MEKDTTSTILIFLFIYFFPTLIAAFRKHKNENSIFLTNLLLGWTVLGWIGALIWSASDHVEAREPLVSWLRRWW